MSRVVVRVIAAASSGVSIETSAWHRGHQAVTPCTRRRTTVLWRLSMVTIVLFTLVILHRKVLGKAPPLLLKSDALIVPTTVAPTTQSPSGA